MSGKSCIISMHAASAVSDMQQQHNRLVTTKGATTATANSGGSSAVGAQSANPAAHPAALLPVAPAPGGLNGANAKASSGTNPSTDVNRDNGAKPSVRDRMKLPLPPPGTGIRHNVQVASDVSKPLVPRGAPVPVPLRPQGTGIRHNIQISADISTPSTGVPRGAAAYEAKVAAAAAASKKVAAPLPKNDTDNKQQQNARGKTKHPATKIVRGKGEAEDDSYSDSGSCSDDDSSSSKDSYDSDATSDLDDSNSSFSSAGSSSPQHDQMEAETENVSPDLEYAVIAHRKKGLLLSRLSEVSVRGTLFVVSANDSKPSLVHSYCSHC
jgi:hypothetical protein